MTKVVLATHNQGKLAEISALLKPLDIQLVSLQQLQVEAVEETGSTFVENAMLKARHACAKTGFVALADDSGLVVPSLSGAPGVHSARFAGSSASDSANNLKLLEQLAGKQRDAFFVCVLVLLRSVEDPVPVIVEGRWDGKVLDQPRGTGGFGYDPLFLIPALGKTAAELPLGRKNQLSHRGQAARRLISRLRSSNSALTAGRT